PSPSLFPYTTLFRSQEVQLLPARSSRDHEVRFLQDSQVLHDPEPGHLQLRLELGERAAVTLEQPVEQEPSGGVRERPEHAVVVRSEEHTSELQSLAY